jgi:hypothetical protein
MAPLQFLTSTLLYNLGCIKYVELTEYYWRHIANALYVVRN